MCSHAKTYTCLTLNLAVCAFSDFVPQLFLKDHPGISDHSLGYCIPLFRSTFIVPALLLDTVAMKDPDMMCTPLPDDATFSEIMKL